MKKLMTSMLSKEVERLIHEHESYLSFTHRLHERDIKYCGKNAPVVIHKPKHWGVSNLHNPYYVKKYINGISHSISEKIIRNKYKPRMPHIHIVNVNGKQRKTAIFELPDEIVSKYYYRHLLQKNRHRLSSLSYAYRDDRNVHFAIQNISYELKQSKRLFVAEFDFKDFFGSISHQYIEDVLTSGYFYVTKQEFETLKGFLPEGQKGIYLGTSVSLFIANAICHSLDESLERIGLKFARYADDTLIWSEDYAKICDAYNLIAEFSKKSGVDINYKKSKGISLLHSNSMVSELSTSSKYVEFCGYKISSECVSIKASSVDKIKKNISILINKYLLKPVRPNSGIGYKIPGKLGYDPAYLSTILQIRRYIYGQLNDEILINYIRGIYNQVKIKGLMSFYPLVNDEKQLKELDGWLERTLFNSIKKREKYFNGVGSNIVDVFPYYLNRNDFLSGSRKMIYNKADLFKVPSFMLVYSAIRIGVERDGVAKIMNPLSNVYNYI